jgi:hypothetical protein
MVNGIFFLRKTWNVSRFHMHTQPAVGMIGPHQIIITSTMGAIYPTISYLRHAMYRYMYLCPWMFLQVSQG